MQAALLSTLLSAASLLHSYTSERNTFVCTPELLNSYTPIFYTPTLLKEARLSLCIWNAEVSWSAFATRIIAYKSHYKY